ncbi:MAG: tetratricopeptide repeat protein [Acidobacteriota bacterium]|nr:tetratricopeptide repeat protein [Acidobacteriota bacterium]
MYLLIGLTIFVVSGCGLYASETDNTGLRSENLDSGTENTNQEAVLDDEEVPTFEDAETALQKGTEYLDDDRLEMAINALKQAVELDKDFADAHFQLGVALSLKESEEEKQLPEADGADDTKTKEKTETKESEIAFKNAVTAYKKVIAKDSKNHRAYYNLGRSYVKLFDDKEARKALEQAVKLNDEDSLYRTELGAVLIKLAQYPLAIRQLDKAIEIDEDNYRAEDLLAKARAGKKRVDHVQKEKPRAGSTSTNSSGTAKSTGPNDNQDEKSSTTRARTVEPAKPAAPKPADKRPPQPPRNQNR